MWKIFDVIVVFISYSFSFLESMKKEIVEIVFKKRKSIFDWRK